MIKIGIMVEVPSVVWSLHLFKNADFFSIGTNDLTQFVFAAGREDQRLDTYRESSLPVILYIVKKLAFGCKHLKSEMVICGEIASDPAVVPLLIGVGVRALSVRVNMLDQIRKEIEGKTMDQAVGEAEGVVREFKLLEG
jgi:phosphoenolpyruvate-protein kinase (PTS system EI component)